MQELVDKLFLEKNLTEEEFFSLIKNRNSDVSDYLLKRSREVSQAIFGRRVYVRGLIEISSFCKNDCYYCGIRHSNKNAQRYQLDKNEILECCKEGYLLGFRTFVLQGGELGGMADGELIEVVAEIRQTYPDCAITLSVGEKSRAVYQQFFDAGANRYLLRHETANDEHYRRLHPLSMSPQNRKRCLWDLKEIGFQVGTGFMVGSPFQSAENIVEDLVFMKKLNPQMIGIGPFIPHHNTPFFDKTAGTAELTLFLIGILRLMFPHSLIPSTTSLGTIDDNGRELGILAGANVIMPNLSPLSVREKYLLYDNKICTGDEAAEAIENLRLKIAKIGYEIVFDRGDFKGDL